MLAYLEPVKQRVSQTLREFFSAHRAQLSAINPMGADAGDRLLEFSLQGKMIRGCLVPLGFALGSRSGAAELPRQPSCAGAAMELFQSGLLVHDDIMDRDLTRRGRPSIFHQYEQAATRQNTRTPAMSGRRWASARGTWPTSWPSSCSPALPVPEPVRSARCWGCAPASSPRWASPRCRTWPGELRGHRWESTQILKMYTYKTGRYSFSLPLMAGALLAGADPVLAGPAWSLLGEILGILFQIRDDELGLFGDEQELGKPIGSDVREGKKTLLYARLMQRAGSRDRRAPFADLRQPGRHTARP